MNATQVQESWLLGIAHFGEACLIILGAITTLTVAILIFMWGWNKVRALATGEDRFISWDTGETTGGIFRGKRGIRQHLMKGNREIG